MIWLPVLLVYLLAVVVPFTVLSAALIAHGERQHRGERAVRRARFTRRSNR